MAATEAWCNHWFSLDTQQPGAEQEAQGHYGKQTLCTLLSQFLSMLKF